MRSEMITLIDKLQSVGIPHEVVRQDLFDSIQVCYPSREHCICDAICHQYSYGGKEGLLEIMGLADTEDGVEGWLTADDVFARMYTDYVGNH